MQIVTNSVRYAPTRTSEKLNFAADSGARHVALEGEKGFKLQLEINDAFKKGMVGSLSGIEPSVGIS